MIGRRCTHSNVFSRPVLIARKHSFCRPDYLSQVLYCGGYCGEDPPLPIPNREVKLTGADGTAPPGGRVGSCRFSQKARVQKTRAFFAKSPTYHLLRGGPLRHPHGSVCLYCSLKRQCRIDQNRKAAAKAATAACCPISPALARCPRGLRWHAPEPPALRARRSLNLIFAW